MSENEISDRLLKKQSDYIEILKRELEIKQISSDHDRELIGVLLEEVEELRAANIVLRDQSNKIILKGIQ